MRIVFFTAHRPAYNPTPVRVLQEAFGHNIPQFKPLQGGNCDGPVYLFCVEASVDVEHICEKHGYNCGLRHEYENIDSAIYNSDYVANVSYDACRRYVLSQKIETSHTTPYHST